MIILQAKFVGDNIQKMENNSIYGLSVDILGSSFSTDGNHHEIGPIMVNFYVGQFPDYNRYCREYYNIEKFLNDWHIVKINKFDTNLPKFNMRKLKSLLTENMRHNKIDQLI